MSKFTLREFHPSDGYFALILENGEMIAEVFSLQTARRIIDALKAIDPVNRHKSPAAIARGKLGGKSKSARKREAVRANLQKARAKRWLHPIVGANIRSSDSAGATRHGRETPPPRGAPE